MTPTHYIGGFGPQIIETGSSKNGKSMQLNFARIKAC
jgi:hypothetical protein